MAPLLWFLPVVVALLTQVTTPAAVHCPDKCGNVTIPYPFGIGKDCSWRGQDHFVLSCDEKSQRLFVGNVEVLGITLETGEMLVNNPMTEACHEQNKGVIQSTSAGFVSANSQYLVSATGNEFTAIGCNAVARMSGKVRAGDMITGCITYCASIQEAAKDGEPCTGLGCCKASIATGINRVDVSWSFNNNTDYKLPVWQYNPCMYAFVAKKGWYNFSRNDLTGLRTFVKEVGNKVPLVLDWAIRDGWCPPHDSEAKLDYACVSNHSYCVNTTNGEGYFCNCSQGYNGNPYIRDNCTNINECMQGENPCKSGTCHDTDGGYECKCKFGQKGDGKTTCQPILPWPAAAAIGITIVVSLVAVALIRKRMKDENRKLREHFNRNGGQLLKDSSISIFTKENLDKITKNFSTTIGKGSFGQVYEGTTDDKQRVAVKRSIVVDAERQKDFANEINIQSKISHKNLVRLIGCCLETDVPMLVYEFIDRGSLYDMLHGGGAVGTKNDVPEEKQSLPLQVRLDISIGSAEALAYMHSSDGQKILHGDVKSGNILLHENFSPKISDFGTSRLLSMDKKHTQFVVGDMGYIDPVYMQTGLLTEKSDVYSFGVVLLELITRKKTRYDKNNSLRINFVKSFLTESRAREMFDQEVLCNENLDCLMKVGGIAVQCLREDVDERPTMMKVLEDLRMVRGEFAC